MQLRNLQAVQLLGAGVETVTNDPDIPDTVPLLRVADPLMGVRMATWVRCCRGCRVQQQAAMCRSFHKLCLREFHVPAQVVWAVTNTQRHMDVYLEHQRKNDWCAC